MAKLGYELTYNKHIAFKPKDKSRFTSSKMIGKDYTEERLKGRITENQSIKAPPVKKRIINVINMNTNAKVKKSKGYEYWATKHSLNTIPESVVFIREHGIKSVKQLDEYIKKAADKRQYLRDKIKVIDIEIQKLFANMNQVYTIKKYSVCYKEYRLIRLTRHF